MAMLLFGVPHNQPKRHRLGTHRACTPRETYERWQGVARALGVTRLANVTGLDVIGLPVWVAVRPNSRGLSTSQGKGMDSDSARVSAMMEAIETWHAEHIELPVRVESAARLRQQQPLVEPAKLARYADQPLRDDAPLPWVRGWCLLQNQACWVPLEAVSTNYVAATLPGAGLVPSSNGLASGNHLLEAISHALAELIERDAVALSGLPMRECRASLRIDPKTVPDPECQALLRMLHSAGVQVALFDLTSDLGIPVMGATIADHPDASRWRTLPAFNGYGCHLEPSIALMRALSEAVQSRLTHISGSRDDIVAADYARGGNADDLAALAARLAQALPQRDFRAVPRLACDSFEADIEQQLAALRRAGLARAVVVDLGQDTLGVPVVKVVVPGLGAPTPMLRARPLAAAARAGARLLYASASASLGAERANQNSVEEQTA
jgi:YcaO-like protein with predicted kinase domain